MGPLKNHSVLDQALNLNSMDENPVEHPKVGRIVYSPSFVGFQERNLSVRSDNLMNLYFFFFNIYLVWGISINFSLINESPFVKVM